MAIGIGIGIPFKRIFSWSRYWNPLKPLGGESVNFWAKGRTGLTMPDSVGGNDISITTPTFIGNGASSLTSSGGVLERLFDGGSYTLYFKMKQIVDVSTGLVFKMGNDTTATKRGLLLWAFAVNESAYISFCDGTNYSELVQCATINTTLKNIWVEVFIEVDKVNNRVRTSMFKCSDGSAIGVNRNVDISTWTFNNNDNFSVLRFDNVQFAFADVKKFSALKTIAQCRDNTFVTDLQFYYPELLSGTDVSGNAHHLQKNSTSYLNNYYSNISTYLLDYGYSLYRSLNMDAFTEGSSFYEDIYVPNNPAGVPIARTILDGQTTAYKNVGNYTGNLIEHNLADSRLNIPVAQWDKSSTTIFADAVRSSIHYSATNTDEWNVRELDWLLYSQNCKANNKGLNFFKISDNSLATNDRKTLNELFSFTTDKISADLNKILRYTGDSVGLNDAIQLYCDASVEQDVSITLSGFIAGDSIQIYWGDGTKKRMILMDETVRAITHTYSGTSLYPIYVCNPENIKAGYLGSSTVFAIYPLNQNIGEFAKAVNIQAFTITYDTLPWHGSINGLPTTLETLFIEGAGGYDDDTNDITGNISKFINLTWLRVFGGNTITGDITGLVNMVKLFNAGHNTMYGSVSGMINLQYLEGRQVGVTTPINGDISGLSNLTNVCHGNGKFSGNISAMTGLQYFQSDSPNITGSISALINLWSFSLPNQITGSLASLSLLEEIQGQGGVTQPSDFSANPKLCYLLSTWTWTSIQTNKILADLWANKDEPRVYSALRNITIEGAPTGQGAIDKEALQAYRSPTPPGTAALWTITTDPVIYDARASQLFTNMITAGETPTTARKANIDTTILALKAADLFDTQFDVLIVTRGTGLISTKMNWIKDSSNALGVTGGGILTYTNNVGYNSDEINSYLRTQFTPATDGVLYKQNDACAGYKVSGTISAATRGHGGIDVGLSGILLCSAAGNQRLNCSTGGGAVAEIGYNCLSRNVNTKFRQMINATTADVVANSTALSALEQYIFRVNYSSVLPVFATEVIECYWFGKDLSEANFAIFQTIMNAYIAAL